MPIENLDWYVTIAKQHLVCEDYAFIGWMPVPYMIVCDGCSSSEHTDVGARILALSAKTLLQSYWSAPERSLPTYEEFGYAVIAHAMKCIEGLRLNVSCLDATLLLAFYAHRNCYVYVYGDGYILTVSMSGEISYRQVSFAQNMPYYLTYWSDERRRIAYMAANHDEHEVKTVGEYRDTEETVSTMPYDAPLKFVFSDRDYRTVALTSDGMSSLLSVQGDTKIPVREVVEQLVGYKTTKGDFVKRRAKRMLKDYEKQEVVLTDDLSITTMLMKG